MPSLVSTSRGAQAAASLRRFLRCVGDDAPLYALLVIYLAATFTFALQLDATRRILWLAYWKHYATLFGMALFLCALVLAIGDDPRRPLTAFGRRLAALAAPRPAATALFLLALPLLFDGYTTAKNLLSVSGTFDWDIRLAEADRWLHGGTDPWRWLFPLLGHEPVTRALEVLYVPGWFMTMCLTVAAATLARRDDTLRGQFFATFLLAWMLLGTLAAGLFLSAGPAYFGHVTGDHDRFGPLISFLSFSHGLDHSASDYQTYLWRIFQGEGAGFGSGISAFPSMHLAMSTLSALVGFRLHRRAGVVATAYAAVILAGSVHLGWHYAVDGYASIVAVILLWHGVGRGMDRLGRRPLA